MNHNASTFPTVPPSLSAGDRGTQSYYADQDTPRPIPYTAPDITPYLGLRARLSQVWINRWTILLLLVLVRTLIAISGIHNDLGSAKREALSACSSVEDMGSALASMPYYMSHGVNDLAAHGVEKAVNGLMSMLMLSVTGVEDIVLFVINLMTSTYVCLITLAISGSLHVALQVIEDAADFLNKSLKDVGDDIDKTVNTFLGGLNSFANSISSGLSEIDGGKKVPTLDLNASLNALENLTLPSSLDQGLTKLNNSIPTFAQVNNFTNNAISLPFEEVKKLINDSMTSYQFNRSLFPIPQKEQLTFCSDNNDIAHFFQDLVDILHLAHKIFVAVITILAILVCFAMAYQEIMRWRTMQKRALLVRQQAFDPMDVVYIASRPYTATAGIKVASKFRSTKRQLLARWVIAYGTSAPALFILSLAIAGLFSCLCQYVLLKSLEKEVPSLIQEVGNFAGIVVDKLDNASEKWANGANSVINSTNTDINHDVFGWVNTTTGALNDTLNEFVDGMTGTLNATFGGTVLYDPITEVLNCLIGLKIAGIQKALDWVSDHAHVDFPEFPTNTFSLGAAASLAANASNGSSGTGNATASFLASPGSEATDKISAAVMKVTDHIEAAIRTEAIISTVVLLIWVLVVLGGAARALFLAFRRDKVHGEGGQPFDNNDAANENDIPLQDRHPISESAPAYEPPIGSTSHAYAAFGSGVHEARGDSSSGGGSGSEEEWQDRKLGFAGERAPARKANSGVGRRSEYGSVEKL